MEGKFSFGIGCFHFGVKKIPPFKFEGSEYINKLRTTLQSISNIDNISIYCDEEFENSSTDVTEELPNISKGVGLFPKPLFMDIEFQLYIPYRIQAQLLEQTGLKQEIEFLETFTEKFKVSIHYTYDLPVAFVEPINPSQKGTSSEAVIIVRKFLIHEFESSKSDYIQFEWLGPSPFHADCYIQSGETPGDNERNWEFEVKRLSQRGYDTIIFYFNPIIFAKAEEAKEAIIEEIQDELGFFYSLEQIEVEKMYDWEEIQDSVDQLISIQREKGIKGFLKKMFTCSKHINEAFISIAEFESNELFHRNIILRHYRNIYSDKKETYFQFYVNKKIKDRFTYPTKQGVELISLFESRRIKSVEIFVVLISAMIGGGIGALLTIFLSK